MKKYIFILFCICIVSSTVEIAAQQVLPYITNLKTKSDTGQQSVASETKTSNDTDRVFVYGISSAEALQFDQLTVAGSLCVGLRLAKHWGANVAFNYGTQTAKKQQADSVPLSLFFFPDIANTSFLGGVNYSLKPDSNHLFSIAAEASIQRRVIERDSLAFDFGIVNFNIGPRYQWVHERKGHRSILTFGINYNYVRINRNNTDAFNTVFNDYNPGTAPAVKRYFHGVGAVVSLELGNAIVFARTYTDFNQSGDLAFTVGIKAAATFFSF